MHRHPWRIVRALRVLFACLMLMLPAAPARHAQVVPDTVVFVAYAATALQVAAAAHEVAPENAEAPRAGIETRPAKAASFVRATAPLPADPSVPFVPADRWLLHCALLC
ncbi:hypothetical protein [Polyangium jinanense]|uniref:Secreted protein n=1 Tax=Polyangium jinanense TaxID=2829994 RepID=A0A9X3WZQ8_9BACT|nr:hypothetical protein [Polyangium jinanense]MDC3954827.1 hypothetical protein [Polyangium jinanense]MDC3981402.1 hypothetical protein [Polyangium jinanense]